MELTDKEKADFDAGYDSLGGQWSAISREHVKTKTPEQVRLYGLSLGLKSGITLRESVQRVLTGAGPAGMRTQNIAAAIKKEKALYDLSGVKKPDNSVNTTFRQRPDLFVKISPGVWALHSAQP